MTSVFSVQDETGTVTQLSLVPSPLPAFSIAVGDTGIYAGTPDDGTNSFQVPAFVSLPFVVSQVLSETDFSVQTNNANMADWPPFGTITWETGANATDTAIVAEINGANAYTTLAEFQTYHDSRGNAYAATDAAIQAAIVHATDYLDQRYRYNGIKLLQSLGNAAFNANAAFLASWLTPYSFNGSPRLAPATSTQTTEWPRQGVVDFNGNTIHNIPKQIKWAAAELALRVLNGDVLQPDYDSGVVSNGAVVQSISKEVGPLKKTVTYDTKLGLGFFPTFPHITRMLSRAGLISSGGGRSVIR